MNRFRMTQLLVGHALAEGTPAGEVMRRAGSRSTPPAGATVDAGWLAVGLRADGFPADLAELAGAWPEALRPALRRLGRLPSQLVLFVRMGETLAYLMLIAMLQALVLSVLGNKVVPVFYKMAEEADVHHAGAWLALVDGAGVLLGITLLIGPIALGLLWLPVRLPGWSRHLQRAREAALAAALEEADAPADARRAVLGRFRVLKPAHATSVELDLVFERSAAACLAAQRRLVAVIRGVGLGALCLVALLSAAGVYNFVVRMHHFG